MEEQEEIQPKRRQSHTRSPLLYRTDVGVQNKHQSMKPRHATLTGPACNIFFSFCFGKTKKLCSREPAKPEAHCTPPKAPRPKDKDQETNPKKALQFVVKQKACRGEGHQARPFLLLQHYQCQGKVDYSANSMEHARQRVQVSFSLPFFSILLP
jgi:hypothetical protein